MNLRSRSVRHRFNSRRASRNQHRRLFLEGLESRRLLAADLPLGDSPWQNHDQPLDANGDNSITSLDFVVVVNAVNRLGDGAMPYGALPYGAFPYEESPYEELPYEEPPNGNAASDAVGESGMYPDINGDQFITSLDALALANWFLHTTPDSVDALVASVIDLAPQSSSGSTPDNSSLVGEAGADELNPGEPISDGSNPDGSNPDGSNPDGSDTGGSDTDGSDTDGSDTDGSDTGGSDTGGSDTGGSDTGGSDTGGSDSGGSDSGGSDSDGSDTDGSDTDGSDTGGSDTGGSDTGGSDTGGSDTGGSDSGGSDSGGSDSDGSDTDGSDTDGSDTGGSDTGGSDTDGSDSGGSDTDGSDSGGSDTDGSDSGGSDTDGSDSGGSDTDGSDSGGSDTDGSDTDGSDTDGSDTDGSDSGGSDSDGSDSGGSDSGGSDTDGSDSGGSDSGGSDSIVCDTPSVTISAPSDVDEYSIFTVSGSAKHAERIEITATGVWAYVDRVGTTPGRSYDAATGAFSQKLIFKDDHPSGTPVDMEIVMVDVTGPCGGSAFTFVKVHNTPVTASATVAPPEINEGESVELNVTFSDAILDGQTILVDWGDGQTSTIQYADTEPNPPLVRERLAFLGPPPLRTFTEEFSHQYLDDNPTATPSDKYLVKVTVSDNDASSTVVTTTVTVKNIAPKVTIVSIVPLDNVVSNGRIDETEGFWVYGTVEDPGVLDTHTGAVKADLNWDGDFDDPGEQIAISSGGGGWGWPFAVKFAAVPDDGPSPGNVTASDPIKVLVEVFDDDTGLGTSSRNSVVFNSVPRVLWDQVQLTYTRDGSDNIDSVTIVGQFEDIGPNDVHQVGIKWGDGGAGNGTSNPLPITGRSFSVTRAMPPSFGSSIRRIFPISLAVRDDDTGVDSGQLDGTTHWSFDGAERQIETKDLTPKLVEPLVSPALAGAKWKGYGEARIAAVLADSNSITGSADAASALAFPGYFDPHDFTQNLQFRAKSSLTFGITCDRDTGDISNDVSGGGGGFAIKLDKDGKFLGWDLNAYSLPHYGPLGASTNVQIGVTSGAGKKTVEVDVEAHFGLATAVTITTENGPQIDGPGGKITIKRGTSSSYPGGLEDFARAKRTYQCLERLKLTKTDLKD